jgi:hypothetical protein
MLKELSSFKPFVDKDDVVVAAMLPVNPGARDRGCKRVGHESFHFARWLFWLQIVGPNIENDSPNSVRLPFPYCNEEAERLRLFIIARFFVFPPTGRVAEIGAACDGGKDGPPNQDWDFRFFFPIFLPVLRTRRKDSGIISKELKGSSAKIFLESELGIAPFRFDQGVNRLFEIDVVPVAGH